MIDEVTLWYRFAALLPEPAATRVRDCWNTGEQEAGLDALVSGLQTHRVVISETTLAEIAVLVQAWGMGDELTHRLLCCAAVASGDGDGARLRLIEHPDARPLPSPGADHVLVPWIGCGRCGAVLARAHTVEPWGGLSYLPVHYAVMGPGSVPARVFPPRSPWPALAALRDECAAARAYAPGVVP
ncbi:hypothetical protein E2C00_22230 [Streptomyces sp. WAC05374]|uniref:hypothetical protein n=1 Tax=Streptomyces sp. WAC05374 TaxID=2487420 RepID=UPI000F862C76|nr:hypothetical protein [Streptomyces sp. WAC05374]RST08086.1 hypothetical protein EF905_30835 [Streptomyces sp. WAC05374]TDF45982.1 hypothetical protein E2B92_11235 [Streptomyces sp. WAC05374]TDF52976.1 hypothetical protein E2C00_22230 [Streptomyces sp. WAC05374]TDF58190.1 hypothetical protein E2C02_06625 [Streptomyces sp. WAC05374]